MKDLRILQRDLAIASLTPEQRAATARVIVYHAFVNVTILTFSKKARTAS
jgi:hypothetical protein